jgi:hypothetical protein
VRQKYFSVADDIHVASLSPLDLSPETPCPCRPSNRPPSLQHGDFVLVKERDRLQPFRFEGYDDTRAFVRKLNRRRDVEGVGKINELLWTRDIIDVSIKHVVRKCHVVKAEEEIPALADWGGSCDWFFYRAVKIETEMEFDTKIEVDDSQTETTQEEASTMPLVAGTSTGLDLAPAAVAHRIVDSSTLTASSTPTAKQALPIQTPSSASEVGTIETDNIQEDQKLSGLDLFCGGGNFGRGIALAGAVRHKWYCVLYYANPGPSISIPTLCIRTRRI